MVEGDTPCDGGCQRLDHHRSIIPYGQPVCDCLPLLRRVAIERFTAFDNPLADVFGELTCLLLRGGARRDEYEELTAFSYRVFEDGLQSTGRLAFYRAWLRQFFATAAVDPVHAHIEAGERPVAKCYRAPI